MVENYSKYIIILWIIIQYFMVIHCQTIPFKPSQRYSHTATLIEDKLYILGGQNDLITNNGVGKEFFYLDVSVPFNVQDILWHDLTSVNIVPAHYSAASVKGGAYNNNLILYGGIQHKGVEMALVYKYDTQNNSWSVPITTGYNVTRKANLKGVVNVSAKMYLFGGSSDKILLNDMLIIDTINYNMTTGVMNNAPSPRSSYGATILTNHVIIYFVLELTAQSNSISNYKQFMIPYPQIPANNMYYQEQQIPITDAAYFYGQQMIPIHENINETIATSSGIEQQMPITDAAYFYGQQMVPIHENINETIASPSGIEQQMPITDAAYFYGQQMIPIHENHNETIATSSGNNQMSSAQNIDIVLENFKHDMIQVVRQEINRNGK
ncbi:15544_t:CDS:2 [Funneliformis geosporum]|uniref:15544_t:CDS:1 n=1 Tax=Funneliformis geosporum TaxID=1117311 RepID=A0A9W4SP77_9GLOM|nr:15544_t:CDS:2 [Funneliformis geosporum]